MRRLQSGSTQSDLAPRESPSETRQEAHQHGAREAMLGRIRRALRVAAPRPDHHTLHDRTVEQQPDAPIAAAVDGTNPDGSNVSLINGQVVDAGATQIGESDNADEAAEANGNAAQRAATLRPAPSGDTSLPTAFTSQLTIINNVPSSREWLPQVGAGWEEQAELFAHNAADLRAEFHLFDTREAMLEFLLSLKAEAGWQRAATHSGELTNAAAQLLKLPLCHTDAGYDVAELESCDVGLTECDALVAQTGSVLVTVRSAGGRALSALPPHHVVLARREQMVPDLPAAFALLRERYGDAYPSLISFITGPSRTGDIERILVLGAHGPKRLTILCVAD